MEIQTREKDNMAEKTAIDESTLATHTKRKRCRVKQHTFRDEEPLPKECAGIAHLLTPTLAVKKCPKCGNEVEIFSSDVEVQCGECRFTVINDLNSCTRWCVHSKECGESDFTGETEKERVESFFVATNNYAQQFMKE
jgi:ribosomal protein S27AE